jgi:hypothetical protein
MSRKLGTQNKSAKVDRPQSRSGNYADEGYRKEALRILATFKKGEPDKGKKWIAHEDHDRVLYDELQA